MKKVDIPKVIRGANSLSLGISIVVAIVVGTALGIWFKNLTGSKILLFVGIVFGILAAFRNIQIAYKEQMKNMNELAKDPKYKNLPQDDD